MKETILKTCPRCKDDYTGYPAISRRDNKTEICSACGTSEAVFDFSIHKKIEQERSWLKEK